VSRKRAAVVSAAVAAGALAVGLAGRAALRRRQEVAHPPVGDLPPEELEAVTSFDGTRLEMRAAGPSEGPTLVLAHGFSLDMTAWGLLWPELAVDYRVVAFDQRSHGLSDAAAHGDLSVRAMGRDLVAVVESDAAPEPVVVIGHSMGAIAMLAASEQRPDLFGARIVGAVLIGGAAEELVRGAIGSVADLVRPRLGTISSAAKRVDLLRRAVLASPGDVGGIVTRLTQFGPDAPAHLVDTVVRLAAAARPEVWTHGLAELLEVDFRHSLPRVRVPVLVVVGEHDRVTPPATAVELAGSLPDARLVVLAGSGHLPMLERPNELAKEIRAFTQTLLAPREEGAA
jgi:pimeloyl-ACP methyl ester carboxylesterase